MSFGYNIKRQRFIYEKSTKMHDNCLVLTYQAILLSGAHNSVNFQPILTNLTSISKSEIFFHENYNLVIYLVYSPNYAFLNLSTFLGHLVKIHHQNLSFVPSQEFMTEHASEKQIHFFKRLKHFSLCLSCIFVCSRVTSK